MSVVQISQKEQSICLEKIIIMSLLKNKNLIFKTFFVCIFLSIQECYLTLFKDCLKIIKKCNFMPIQKNVSISLWPTVPKTLGRAKCFEKNNLDWFALLGAFCRKLTSNFIPVKNISDITFWFFPFTTRVSKTFWHFRTHTRTKPLKI